MQIQLYAADQISSERGYLGYVLRGCHSNPNMEMKYSVTSPNGNRRLEVFAAFMISVYSVGNIFLIVLILLVSVHFLRKQGSFLASIHDDSIEKSSFSNYGIFWGGVTVSFLGNILMTVFTLLTETVDLSSSVHIKSRGGWMVLSQLVFGTSAALIVALYYGRKLNFAIPSIFYYHLPSSAVAIVHMR